MSRVLSHERKAAHCLVVEVVASIADIRYCSYAASMVEIGFAVLEPGLLADPSSSRVFVVALSCLDAPCLPSLAFDPCCRQDCPLWHRSGCIVKGIYSLTPRRRRSSSTPLSSSRRGASRPTDSVAHGSRWSRIGGSRGTPRRQTLKLSKVGQTGSEGRKQQRNSATTAAPYTSSSSASPHHTSTGHTYYEC